MILNPLKLVRLGLVCLFFVMAPHILAQSGFTSPVPEEWQHKIGSNALLLALSEHRETTITTQSSDPALPLVMYCDPYPSDAQLQRIEQLTERFDKDLWTPPVSSHPYGFFVAHASQDQINKLMELEVVRKLDLAQLEFEPQSNSAVQTIEADQVWESGYEGSSVRVAVLDAGLDEAHPDLPTLVAKKDYSQAPFQLDDDIRTFATGHGTHVTGAVLGRGVLSDQNVGNGGGAYKGMAPAADLIFLKIGNDDTGGASGLAIYNALIAAAETYDANVINLSYGSWDAYHDGSYFIDQKIDDIVINHNIPVIVGAGNWASAGRHVSVRVPSQSASDYIQINVNNAPENSIILKLNLVWYDGPEVHHPLSLEYYDQEFNPLTDVTQFSQSESSRGTEHRVSFYNPYVPAGNSTFYVKIINSSDSEQLAHIYEDFNKGRVRFQNPDPYYTVTSPSTADMAFSVGSCGTKEYWTDYLGNEYSSYTAETLSSFSGRGPRVDHVQKPQIVAPGKDIISLRDGNAYTNPATNWVDNDGADLGDASDANYVVMTGTSMATPMTTGAAALVLNQYPDYSAAQVYDALVEHANVFNDLVTPDPAWGYGVLDLTEADPSDDPFPELTTFTAQVAGPQVILRWETETDIEYAGFNVYRKSSSGSSYEKLNDALITSLTPNNPNTWKFKYHDFPPANDTYLYQLENISLNGNPHLYEPLEVEFEAPPGSPENLTIYNVTETERGE